MICGLDTTFLIQIEVEDSEGHEEALLWMRQALTEGRQFALAPQVLTEFLHIVTDPKRFPKPLPMHVALEKSHYWWSGAEVHRVFPTMASVEQFHRWIDQYRLGRKRLLDTMLAATYITNGVREIVTSDARDYRLFGFDHVTILRPKPAST